MASEDFKDARLNRNGQPYVRGGPYNTGKQKSAAVILTKSVKVIKAAHSGGDTNYACVAASARAEAVELRANGPRLPCWRPR